ncbi:hypothetical protein [Desulforamulus aquiferis]|nr:hypothetical protein [Desulforamulus aquiferis]
MLIIVAIIGVLLLSGLYYFKYSFLNTESMMDAKDKAEQKKELLSNERFGNLPEVVELKEQMAQQEKKNSPGGQDFDAGETAASVPSQGELEARLVQKMQSLQGEYNGKINSYIAAAKKEYEKIESGQITMSKKALAQKYIGLVEGMEAECDARVYAAIARAENELTSYGYSTDIADKARETYRQTKKQQRSQLLSKL